MISAFRNNGIASFGRFASVKAIPESFKDAAVSTLPLHIHKYKLLLKYTPEERDISSQFGVKEAIL
jgi:hypothetical protein